MLSTSLRDPIRMSRYVKKRGKGSVERPPTECRPRITEAIGGLLGRFLSNCRRLTIDVMMGSVYLEETNVFITSANL